MTPALAVVLLVLAALVAFVVWVLRASSRHARERAVHVRGLADRLGGVLERDSPLRITGALDGRRYILTEHRSGTRTTRYFTHIEVPLTSPVRVQIQPQESDLGARLAGDQQLGDAAFDAACFVRTSHMDVLQRALDVSARRRLVEGCTEGDLLYVSVNDGPLRLELRRAPDDPEREALVTAYLRLAVELAARIDMGREGNGWTSGRLP